VRRGKNSLEKGYFKAPCGKKKKRVISQEKGKNHHKKRGHHRKKRLTKEQAQVLAYAVKPWGWEASRPK